MSYLRPLSLQPLGLKQSALDAWNSHLIQIIRDAQIICRRGVSPSVQSFSNSLKVLRNFDDSDDAGDGCCNIKELTMNLDAEMLDAYVKSFLPASLQEESFHRGAQMLRKELYFDMFPRYFRLTWKPHFRHLDLPPISDTEHRIATLNLIATAFSEEKAEHRFDSVSAAPVFIETAKFRLFETCEIGIEESYLLKRIVRTSLTNLRVLVLWWICDDQLLNIIGTSCQFLESLDAWRSTAVTDLGIKMMLASDDFTGSSKLCHTLKRLVVKETSCTHIGCLVAMIKAVNLEVLSFSHTTNVVKDFFEEIRNMMSSAESSAPPLSYSLKTLFLPVADGTDLEGVIRAFPKLEDLRLWTSAPQLRQIDSSDFPKLHSVLLGGLRSNRILKDLVRGIGVQLTTLKEQISPNYRRYRILRLPRDKGKIIETVMSDIPIGVVGDSCPNLVELQVVNGRIALDDGHSCSSVSATFFANLKLVYLFLVQYMVERPVAVGAGEARISPLQCLLTHAKGIQVIQATGCPGFNDLALKDVVTTNPMRGLRRFILTDASSVLVRNPDQAATVNAATATGGYEDASSGAARSGSSSENSSLALTSASVMRLFDTCPLLQCVGDLRHWNIESAERRAISKRIQEKTGVRWISTM